ncbi:hypothetical protein BBOMB_1293 [Bifidobacterium bombi DSM 19703]|uniref:DUF4244 domain-containing protein n=2 Tax=Bifidobacterium bombi TaxID=471511 RepID=A0A086BPM0_9BIFI|nr:hypothetical protein BBOMB_1293 [Bifidobacterium bombi DSM 19703]
MNSQEIDLVSSRSGMLTAQRKRLAQAVGSIRQKACMLDMKLRTLSCQVDEGAATAEYAIVLVAATGFGAVLVGVLKSDMARKLLEGLVKKALGVV